MDRGPNLLSRTRWLGCVDDGRVRDPPLRKIGRGWAEEKAGFLTPLRCVRNDK